MEKTSAYVLSIVGIVGVVAIAVLMLNGVSTETTDLTGMAVGTCTDSDGGMTYTTQGTVTGSWYRSGVTSSWTDSCKSTTSVKEYYCRTDGTAYMTTKSCATVGAGYTCSAGACVNTATTDSDSDGVYDSSDVCAGYDDTLDTDSDGTPDGCDSDDDGDGYSDADETAAGSDPEDATSVPVSYPDLVIDSSATTASLSGEAVVSSSGIVLDDGTVRVAMVGAIKNQGTATASGTSYNLFYLYYGSNSITLLGGTKTLNIGAGATDATSYVATGYSIGSTTGLSLLQALYDSGSATVSIQSTLDSSTSRGRYITESDETNNGGTVSVTLSSSSVTFTEAECTEHADCASGCGCFDYMCYVLASNSTSTEYYSSGVDC